MTRTRLSDRQLPVYSQGEELLNSATHLLGSLLSVAALVLSIIAAARNQNPWGVAASAVYGACMILLYTVSGVYHGMKPGMAKKVMQVIDHCTIYLLIAGSYTVVVLSALRPLYPALSWCIFGFEWAVAAVAVVLTAIDLKKYAVFSMVCYIGLGWAILPFARQTMEAMGFAGFQWLLWGGIAYTVGSVAYGLGRKQKWMHSVFHFFVLLGSILQFIAVLRYAL